MLLFHYSQDYGQWSITQKVGEQWICMCQRYSIGKCVHVILSELYAKNSSLFPVSIATLDTYLLLQSNVLKGNRLILLFSYAKNKNDKKYDKNN